MISLAYSYAIIVKLQAKRKASQSSSILLNLSFCEHQNRFSKAIILNLVKLNLATDIDNRPGIAGTYRYISNMGDISNSFDNVYAKQHQTKKAANLICFKRNLKNYYQELYKENKILFHV